MTNFYPNKPTKAHRVNRIMQLTGWKPKPFYWQDKTVCDYKDKGPGINRYCTDIRKSTVEKAFKEVFGYGSFVDPNGTGKAVIKSEENWAKDGRIVDLPYELKEGEVCQKYIDTLNEGSYYEERALIVGGKVLGWLIKKKPNRFDSVGCDMRFQSETDPEFDVGVNDFCKEIGMDYGEIDILFDEAGFPYIIDANKTPGGFKWVDKLGDEFINAHRPLFL